MLDKQTQDISMDLMVQTCESHEFIQSSGEKAPKQPYFLHCASDISSLAMLRRKIRRKTSLFHQIRHSGFDLTSPDAPWNIYAHVS